METKWKLLRGFTLIYTFNTIFVICCVSGIWRCLWVFVWASNESFESFSTSHLRIARYSVILLGLLFLLIPTEPNVSRVLFSKPVFSFVATFLTQTRESKMCCLNNCASKCTKQCKLALNPSNSHLIFLCAAFSRGSCFIVLKWTLQCLKLFYLGGAPYMAWIYKQNPTALFILHVCGIKDFRGRVETFGGQIFPRLVIFPATKWNFQRCLWRLLCW